jgi:hypothetical protein
MVVFDLNEGQELSTGVAEEKPVFRLGFVEGV